MNLDNLEAAFHEAVRVLASRIDSDYDRRPRGAWKKWASWHVTVERVSESTPGDEMASPVWKVILAYPQELLYVTRMVSASSPHAYVTINAADEESFDSDDYSLTDEEFIKIMGFARKTT